MKFIVLIDRVKSNLRDIRGTAFQEADIKSFINEGIDRVRQVIKECSGMKHLVNSSDVPILLPEEYHHLLALYSSSRCFAQDERHYQATNLMNEFEIKLADLKELIVNGEVEIVDEFGDPVPSTMKTEYVFDNYYNKRNFNKLDGTKRDEVF